IRLGIARRVNLPKLPPPDIERAVIKYQAGDSLATVGKALNVDASTVSELSSGPVWRFGHGPDAEAPCRRSLSCLEAVASGEDDLATRSDLIELAHNNDALDLLNEVVFGEAEQVDGGLAGIHSAARIPDELHEFGDTGDVERLHLLFHQVRRDSRHPGQDTHQAGHVHPRVADGGNLDVLEPLAVDGVESEEGEEEGGLDALRP